MNKFIELVKVNIIMALSQMNIVRVSSEKRQGRGYLWMIGAVFVVVMIYLGVMFNALYEGLAPYGMQWLLLLMFFVMLTLMTLITSLFSVSGVLFEGRDLDRLFSYPLSSDQILLSKVTALIIDSWPLNLLVALPTFAVYCYHEHPSPMFYLSALLGFLFIPLLPLAATIILNFVINLISMGKRAKNVINIVLLIAAAGSLSFLSKRISTDFQTMAQGSSSFLDAIRKFYPPAGYFMNAVSKGSVGGLLLFLAVSIIPFAILTFLLSKWYGTLRSKSSATKRVKSKGLAYKASSHFVNQLRKEFGRFFSSPMYVLNTGIGMILITLFALSACFSGKQFRAVLTLFADYKTAGMVAFFCVFAALADITAPSISLEGKSLWILKSSPSGAETILLAKLCVQLIITVPLLVIDSVILSVVMHFQFLSFLWLCLIPALMSALGGLVGLIANLRYHRFDFYNDMQVVKNSASVMISMFGMWLVIGVFAGIYLLCRSVVPFDVFAVCATVILLALTAAAGRYVFTEGKRQFELL